MDEMKSCWARKFEIECLDKSSTVSPKTREKPILERLYVNKRKIWNSEF